jgi:hypothetical protein
LNRKHVSQAEWYLNSTRKKPLLCLVKQGREGNIFNLAHAWSGVTENLVGVLELNNSKPGPFYQAAFNRMKRN